MWKSGLQHCGQDGRPPQAGPGLPSSLLPHSLTRASCRITTAFNVTAGPEASYSANKQKKKSVFKKISEATLLDLGGIIFERTHECFCKLRSLFF